MKTKVQSIKASALKGIAILILSLTTIFVACKKDKPVPPAPDPEIPTEVSKLIYVANEDDGTISVIDGDKGTQVNTIELMDGSKMFMPHNVQVAPDGKSVWVTGVPMIEGDEEQVIVIDPGTNTIISRIKPGHELHLAHVILDDASNFAYVTANESNQIIKIDARTFTEVKRFNMDSAHKPHGLRYAGGKLFVACMDAKSMAVIDLATEQMIDIPLGGIAVQTALSVDGKYAFVSKYDTREITVYDLHTQQIKNVSLPAESQGPIQMYATPDSKLLFICDQGVIDNRPASNKVFVYDITEGMIMKTIIVGNAAHGVVVNDVGSRAYVTNSKDNTVSEIDVATNSVVRTIPVGKSPNGISYWYKNYGSTAGMK